MPPLLTIARIRKAAWLGLAILVTAGCRSKPAADASAGDADTTTVDVAPEVADADVTAIVDAGADAQGTYGTARSSPLRCRGVAGPHVSETDLTTSFVDGDDLLALVNRSPTGALPPDYAPSDLVDLRNGKPLDAKACEGVQCLRREAADALRELLAALKVFGYVGKVESAFRSYGAQCGTFLRWAEKGSFCDATEQSALPGHSQHQLGTTIDLFTEEWAADPRGVFRDGFGCTHAATWLREHGWSYGFVLPYPLHPDDQHPKRPCLARTDRPVSINPMTGYRFEHWHLRYIGKEAAAAFEQARTFVTPTNDERPSPEELTLEQWIRQRRDLSGPKVDLPVCDGCNCGACATLAKEGTCDGKASTGPAIHLDEHGFLRAAAQPPRLLGAKLSRSKGRRAAGTLTLTVELDGGNGALTQPPVATKGQPLYDGDATYQKLAPFPDAEPRAFRRLEAAWTLGAEPALNLSGTAFPWRFSLSSSNLAAVYNRTNAYLPVPTGKITLRVEIPEGAPQLRVALLRGGVPEGEILTLDAPP